MTAQNGVNLANVQGLIEAIKGTPALANVTFKANSKWLGGTKAETTVTDLMAGGQNIARPGRSFKIVSDEPPQLGGTDTAPSPVELLAAGLCGCLTAGIATNAALFGADLSKIEVSVEVDFDINGVLGLKKDSPNGATNLRYKVKLAGTGGTDKLTKAKQIIDRKSPVKNTIEMPLKITSDLIIE